MKMDSLGNNGFAPRRSSAAGPWPFAATHPRAAVPLLTQGIPQVRQMNALQNHVVFFFDLFLEQSLQQSTSSATSERLRQEESTLLLHRRRAGFIVGQNPASFPSHSVRAVGTGARSEGLRLRISGGRRTRRRRGGRLLSWMCA